MAKTKLEKFNEKKKDLLKRQPNDYKNEWTLKSLNRDIDRLKDYIEWLELVRCTTNDNKELIEAKKLLRQFKLARLNKMTSNLILIGVSLWLAVAVVCLILS